MMAGSSARLGGNLSYFEVNLSLFLYYMSSFVFLGKNDANCAHTSVQACRGKRI